MILRHEAWLVLGLFFLTSSSTASGDEPKRFDFRQGGRKGLRIQGKESVQDHYEVIAKASSRGNGRSLGRKRFSCSYQDEVINLKPYGINRSYERSRKGELNGASGEPTLTKTAYEGKSVKLTRHGVLFIPGLTKDPGRNKPPILDPDHRFLGMLANALLPAEEKAVGDRWRAPLGTIRRLFNTGKNSLEVDGVFQITFKSLKRKNGHNFARLDLRLDLKGKKTGQNARIKGKGSALVDLERGLVREVKLTYEYEASLRNEKAEAEGKRQRVRIKGERKAKLELAIVEEGSGDFERDARPQEKQKAP